MVAGNEEKSVRIRLLIDAVLNGEPRTAGYEDDVPVGVAGRFTSVGRAVIVSAIEEDKPAAVGSVADPLIETEQVEVENTPKNDVQQHPVGTTVVTKTAKAAKATPVAAASTAAAE